MSAQAVRVLIGGEEFTVRSELPPEYTRKVAEYFDDMFRGVRKSLPTIEAHKAAILAGLAVTDELFQARRGDEEVARRITGLAEELTRLVPSGGGRRGRSAGPGDRTKD